MTSRAARRVVGYQCSPTGDVARSIQIVTPPLALASRANGGNLAHAATAEVEATSLGDDARVVPSSTIDASTDVELTPTD